MDTGHNCGVPKDPRKYLVLVFRSVPIKVNDIWKWNTIPLQQESKNVGHIQPTNAHDPFQ